MPLVYAAVVPHAPLLIPSIAKDHRQLLDATRQQLRIMAGELHARQADVVIMLTPHAAVVPGAISVDVAETHHGRLTEFGDIKTDISVPGAPAVARRLQVSSEQAQFPLVLQTAGQLDYGITVPVSFLFSSGKAIKLIPISVGGQSSSMLVRFGTVLNDFFHRSRERVALIASADLSRRKKSADEQAVMTASVQRPTNDERQVATAITQVDPSRLVAMDGSATFCGLNPILTLIASVQSMSGRGHVDTFEAPFGVGQMTAAIDIPS